MIQRNKSMAPSAPSAHARLLHHLKTADRTPYPDAGIAGGSGHRRTSPHRTLCLDLVRTSCQTISPQRRHTSAEAGQTASLTIDGATGTLLRYRVGHLGTSLSTHTRDNLIEGALAHS